MDAHCQRPWSVSGWKVPCDHSLFPVRDFYLLFTMSQSHWIWFHDVRMLLTSFMFCVCCLTHRLIFYRKYIPIALKKTTRPRIVNKHSPKTPNDVTKRTQAQDSPAMEYPQYTHQIAHSRLKENVEESDPGNDVLS